MKGEELHSFEAGEECWVIDLSLLATRVDCREIGFGLDASGRFEGAPVSRTDELRAPCSCMMVGCTVLCADALTGVVPGDRGVADSKDFVESSGAK